MANISKYLKSLIDSLAAVATSGSYNDLSDKPSLATIAASGSYNDLSDKPQLAAVATSGSYNDLSDKPVVLIETGTFVYSYCNTISGFIKCVGSNLSRTTYANLFSVIGTTFGEGDGSTTFGTPDLRGRLIIGAGQAPGLSNRILGQVFGTENERLDEEHIPSHAHNIARTNSRTLGEYAANGFENIMCGDRGWSYTNSTSSGNHNFIQNTGGGQPHNNMPPTTVAGNWFLKI